MGSLEKLLGSCGPSVPSIGNHYSRANNMHLKKLYVISKMFSKFLQEV